jgi:hypothetical protein
MLLTSDAASNEGGADVSTATKKEPFRERTFAFVPKELAAKCRKLIESYHAMYGYVGLPDMLWLSDAREIIETNTDLARVFRQASKSRGARRAHDSFVAIATLIVSMEVLARDFASWGKRFPAARREAEKAFGNFPLRQRAWLMDLYLYPPQGIRREFASALVPPATGTQAPARD